MINEELLSGLSFEDERTERGPRGRSLLGFITFQGCVAAYTYKQLEFKNGTNVDY